jgi:expansin (peptidoglycan-binding protein)
MRRHGRGVVRLVVRFAVPLAGLAAVAGLAALGACRARNEEPAPGSAAAPPRCTGDELAGAGDATYYDATGAGSCSFAAAAGDPLVAAIAGPDYAHAAWCGACLSVAGPLGEVVVRVVDRCTGCKHGDLDLGRDAFARIAPLSAGRTKVAWHEVPCPVTGPVVYRLKAGSNPQWAAIQLGNHRHAIARLEVREAGGTYRPLPRTDDNYFVATTGLPPAPYALRVSDARGQTLEDPVIALGAGAARSGAAQFPACPDQRP